MVATGMLKGISAGYSVSQWEITDKDGDVIDPDKTSMRWDESGLTFTATRWQLLESSLCGIPADADSAVRSFGGAATGDLIGDVRQRMQARQRMQERQNAHDDRRAVAVDTSDQYENWQRGTPSSVFP
jgi:hypothetical protein